MSVRPSGSSFRMPAISAVAAMIAITRSRGLAFHGLPQDMTWRTQAAIGPLLIFFGYRGTSVIRAPVGPTGITECPFAPAGAALAVSVSPG